MKTIDEIREVAESQARRQRETVLARFDLNDDEKNALITMTILESEGIDAKVNALMQIMSFEKALAVVRDAYRNAADVCESIRNI